MRILNLFWKIYSLLWYTSIIFPLTLQKFSTFFAFLTVHCTIALCDTSRSIVIPNVTIRVSPRSQCIAVPRYSGEKYCKYCDMMIMCNSNRSTVGNDTTMQCGNKVTVKQIFANCSVCTALVSKWHTSNCVLTCDLILALHGLWGHLLTAWHMYHMYVHGASHYMHIVHITHEHTYDAWL